MLALLFCDFQVLFRYEPIRRAYEAMVVQLRPRAINVERGSRGFGLSLIYRSVRQLNLYSIDFSKHY